MTIWRRPLFPMAVLGIAGLLGIAGGSVLAEDGKRFSGKASFYGYHYQGRTASGARYDPEGFTAAHRTLPFGTRIRVIDLRNQRSVTVIVNDRGPFIKGRVIDLSLAAAKALQMTGRGIAEVAVTVE